MISDEELLVEPDVDAAFSELVNRWWSPILGYFVRRVHDYHLAEDLTVDAFMRLFKGRADYDPGRPFRSWLYFQARMVLFSHYQTRRRTKIRCCQCDVAVGTATDPRDPFDVPALTGDLAGALLGHVGKLKRRQGDVVRRLHFDGETQAEVAETMGVTRQAVSLWLHAGLKNLRSDPEVAALI
ncbi:RNA polymerase sigma factor YlaC [Caulifigura coniformis]|uniref:RNA polymerase sigma factor YlaC n=1 Tax=Caulifigura coniformis TaxID=2527983 RepID=A0A517SMD5_9PLAN|nr:sigma-70 family RNA polymerase sigma factor [Caulifigura coniformis]QDT57285.1 RNA polymerase sigma factor YlaC [Caulifigura coniformis]